MDLFEWEKGLNNGPYFISLSESRIPAAIFRNLEGKRHSYDDDQKTFFLTENKIGKKKDHFSKCS